MGIEIERKYLVDHTKWNNLIHPEGKRYRQGYILSDNERTVRVRIASDIAYITLKGQAQGISRSEFEYVIPVEDGIHILKELTISSIEKIRYNINYEGNLWEVDVFEGDNTGLIIAEIELNHQDQQFKKPDWVLNEVSHNNRYTNAMLSIDPYMLWNK